MQNDSRNSESNEKDKKKTNESLKVISKKKKIAPKQILETAMNKDKAEKLKKEIRNECGVRTMYWNHTKNYSTLMKQEEDNYVSEKVKKYNISKFLSFFLQKNYHYSLLRKFVREYIKNEPFKPEDRQKVTISL